LTLRRSVQTRHLSNSSYLRHPFAPGADPGLRRAVTGPTQKRPNLKGLWCSADQSPAFCAFSVDGGAPRRYYVRRG